MGSHIDTVPDAGAYDGVLGVAIALAWVEIAKELKFPINIEVIAFSEEEGVRFGLPFIGSRAVAGRFDEDILEAKDSDGITLDTTITTGNKVLIHGKVIDETIGIKGYQLLVSRVGAVNKRNPGKKFSKFPGGRACTKPGNYAGATASAGLVTGQTYKLTVKAIDTKGNVINTVTSCTWTLMQENDSTQPKLNISGSLAYAFDKANYHGAKNRKYNTAVGK